MRKSKKEITAICEKSLHLICEKSLHLVSQINSSWSDSVLKHLYYRKQEMMRTKLKQF